MLRSYYGAWFPILLQASHTTGVTVFEGFAGPGEYAGGEAGSPLVAMESLLNRANLVGLGKRVRFAFLEEDGRRADHLRGLLQRRFGELPGHVTWEVRQGDCETDAVRFLTDVGAWSEPIFANLDPFNAHVPLPLVRRLARNRSSEVFVTFMLDRLRRFARSQDLNEGDETFGSQDWRAVADQPTPQAREVFLIDMYRRTLQQAGFEYIASFKLMDEAKRSFWLFYATGHPKGLREMKRAMWKVDPIRGWQFRDPRDPAQLAFDLSQSWKPELGPLRRSIVNYLRTVGKVTHEQVRSYVLLETPYKEPHANTAVGQLVRDGKVGRDPEAGQLTNATRVWPIEELTLFGT